MKIPEIVNPENRHQANAKVNTLGRALSVKRRGAEDNCPEGTLGCACCEEGGTDCDAIGIRRDTEEGSGR